MRRGEAYQRKVGGQKVREEWIEVKRKCIRVYRDRDEEY